MASTIATYFRSGVQQSGGYVGCVGYDGGPIVGRFQFTTPATGAATLTFQSTTLTPVSPTTWSSGNPDAFRWAVTESATINMGKIGTDGYETAVDWGNPNHLTGGAAKSVQLLPNRTYYLWIYPTVDSFNRWRIDGITVTMGGVYGEKSTFTATNPATFGSACTITISRNLSSALHTVKVTCLGRTETLLNKGSTYPTLTWTPSVAIYAPLLTNAKSTTATIAVETFYSGYSVGTTSATIIVNFADADVKPTITMAVSDPTGYATTYGAFVATKSKIKVELTASYQYGATYGSAAIAANGQSYSTNPATTDEIASASNTAVTGKIIDSRGVASNTESTTLTILDYSPPQISSFAIHRCNQDGTANDQGAFMRADYSIAITALNNVNSRSLTIKYKKRADSSYTSQSVTLSSYTQSGSVVIAADTNFTYDVKLELVDDFASSAVELQLSTAFATVNYRAGGTGVAFGKVCEHDNALEISGDWEIWYGSSLISEAYAVGDIFVTTRSGNPATLLGYGTWTQIKDRFLLAAGDAYTAGDTGGEASHTLTVDEIPAHEGHLHVNSGFLGGVGNLIGKYLSTGSLASYGSVARGWNEANNNEAYPAGEDRGGGQAHNNMPPYLTVYMWLRTA